MSELDEVKQASKLSADFLRTVAMAANEKFTKTAEKIAQVEFENLMGRARMEAEMGKFEMDCYFIGKEQLQLKCKEMREFASLELVHEVLFDMLLKVGLTIEEERGSRRLFSPTVTIRWGKLDQDQE